MEEDDFQLIDLGSNNKLEESTKKSNKGQNHKIVPEVLYENDVDDLITISDLQKMKEQLALSLEEVKLQKESLIQENKNVKEIKTQLTSDLTEYHTLIQTCKSELKNLTNKSNEYGQLNTTIQKELQSVQLIKSQIEDERNKLKADGEKFKKTLDHFKEDRKQLDELLNKLKTVSKYASTSKDLNDEVSGVLNNNTNKIESELEKIKNIRSQQEELIKKCKIDCETIRTNHNDNFIKSLDENNAYSCKKCNTHIGIEEDIESKCYQIGQGAFNEKKRGYLFSHAHNLILDGLKTETFTTGNYEISWVNCIKCSSSLGWKYISCDNPTNQSKVGKYCIGRYSLSSPSERSGNTTNTPVSG